MAQTAARSVEQIPLQRETLQESVWSKCVFSTDHKIIGLQYMITGMMVAAYFMHLNVEKCYMWFIMFVMLAFLAVLFAGVAPAVMKHQGKNWRHSAEVQVPAAIQHHEEEAGKY